MCRGAWASPSSTGGCTGCGRARLATRPTVPMRRSRCRPSAPPPPCASGCARRSRASWCRTSSTSQSSTTAPPPGWPGRWKCPGASRWLTATGGCGWRSTTPRWRPATFAPLRRGRSWSSPRPTTSPVAAPSPSPRGSPPSASSPRLGRATTAPCWSSAATGSILSAPTSPPATTGNPCRGSSPRSCGTAARRGRPASPRSTRTSTGATATAASAACGPPWPTNPARATPPSAARCHDLLTTTPRTG